MNQLHPALQNIRDNHLRLMEGLTQQMCAIDSQNDVDLKWSLFFKFYEFIINKIEIDQDLPEQLYLFPAIAAKKAICQGGPMCMLYFDIHLSFHPYDYASFVTKKDITVTPGSVAPHLKTFVERNSLICIPMSDHLACQKIRMRANEILRGQGADAALAELKTLANAYIHLRKRNFEKEDNCLLPMAMNLLSEDELNQLCEKMNLSRRANSAAI